MNTETIRLMLYLPLFLTVATICSVPIHECGHLLGGLFSGYRFTMLKLGHFELYGYYGRLKVKKVNKMPLGQCIMHPVSLKQDPISLVLGGCLANILIGTAVLVYSFMSNSLLFMVGGICFGGMNIALGIANLIPNSETNDAGTLKEIKKGEQYRELYNRLMLVYTLLETGRGYRDLPDELVIGPRINNSMLSAELAEYRFCKLKEIYENSTPAKIINEMTSLEVFIESVVGEGWANEF